MTRRHEELIEKILEAQQCIGQAMHAAADPTWLQLDLTMGQLKALIVMADNALTVGQVANMLGIGKPAASILVDRLVQLGFVTRSEDPLDRRRTLVGLTPEGRDLTARLRQGARDRFRGWLEQMDDEALAALVQGMQALVAITGNHTERMETSA